MAEITGALSTAFAEAMLNDEVLPGYSPSYQLCKEIYLHHPLGAKMADSPVKMAQSKKRKISVVDAPEDLVVEAFEKTWKELDADQIIFNAMSLSRIYGVSAVYMGIKDRPLTDEIEPWALPNENIFFSVYDPLNTAGSLVLNQNPLAEDFQKPYQLTAAGVPVSMSRSVVTMNERPIYLAYTSSAYGFSGRSVYQRAIYPLKSFIQTMITDDMVSLKAGVIVAKQEPTGSIADKLMGAASAMKRSIVKMARVGNVISITPKDIIETMDVSGACEAMRTTKESIVCNVATSADMPAVILKNETLTEGFGEGKEDAKMIAAYIEGVRQQMDSLYQFFDRVVQHRAWTPEFYAAIQEKFPEQYSGVDYKAAFMQWRNSFMAEWPSFLEEPPSEQIKVEETKFRAIADMVNLLVANTDPQNRARVIQWAADNLNENKLIFGTPLELDYQALSEYSPEPDMGQHEHLGLMK